MNRQDVKKIITEYLKPIFGFALKRCNSIHDAEDLSQEIAIRAFRALLVKDDVVDMGKFIWTVAHNTLSNYYRDAAKSMFGVSIDEVAELIADPYSELDTDDNRDAIRRLQTEIAYLSDWTEAGAVHGDSPQRDQQAKYAAGRTHRHVL